MDYESPKFKLHLINAGVVPIVAKFFVGKSWPLTFCGQLLATLGLATIGTTPVYFFHHNLTQHGRLSWYSQKKFVKSHVGHVIWAKIAFFEGTSNPGLPRTTESRRKVFDISIDSS